MDLLYLNPIHPVRLFQGSLPDRLKVAQARSRYDMSPGPGAYYVSQNADDMIAPFYLDGDFMPGLRWQWADGIVHGFGKGYYLDDDGGDTVRGIIFRLPHGRGFLAGTSMGENMITYLDRYLWTDERDAARAADDMACSQASQERETRRREREREALAE